MSIHERRFEGIWIPRALYLNDDLSWSEKLLLIEVHSLDQDEQRGCWKSGTELAKFLKLSEQRVAHMITDLKRKGWLEQIWTNGRQRGLRSRMLHKLYGGDENRQLSKTTVDNCQKRQLSTVKNDSSNIEEHISSTEERIERDTRERYETSLGTLVNEDVAVEFDELMVWLQNKKRLKHLPPQEWEQLLIDLAKSGIHMSNFREYYEWVEKLDWVTGTVSPRLLRGQVEAYMRRDELADKRKVKEATNGKRNGGGRTAAQRLAELQAKG